MPMYTAASPGNLLPKFSVPKTPFGPAGTIAHRASVLQKATAVAAAAKPAAGAHCVAGGVAPTPGPAPTNAAAPRRAIREAIRSPLRPGVPGLPVRLMYVMFPQSFHGAFPIKSELSTCALSPH